MHIHTAFLSLLLMLGLGLAPQPTLATTADANDPARIVIEPKGNEMLFEQTEITVEAGQEIILVFDNTASSPAMVHNVVFLNTDDKSAINRVGQAALSAADNEYVPNDEAVLAATPLAKPGETVEVTFTAPDAPGKYLYICTFPGHYAMMQGTMIVQ